MRLGSLSVFLFFALTAAPMVAQEAANSAPTILQQPPVTMPVQALDTLAGGPEKWTSPESLASSLQIMLLLTVLSLAPAILLMTTCYVRIIVVLGLLRQAIGLQSLPPLSLIHI